MVDYEYYTQSYHGDAIPVEEWPGYEQRAADKLRQYKRTYTVTVPEDGAENMAVCAMADALYGFDAVASGSGPVQSASIGSVSVSYGSAVSVDISEKAQEKGLLKAARTYLDIYRGVL